MSLLTWTQHCERCEWKQNTLNIEMNDCFRFYSARIFLYKTFLNINVKKKIFLKKHFIMFRGELHFRVPLSWWCYKTCYPFKNGSGNSMPWITHRSSGCKKKKKTYIGERFKII